MINEVRVDQPSNDSSEYFELVGAPGASLDNLAYIVLGDSTGGGSGVVEAVINLTGREIPASGFFLVTEASFENGAEGQFEGVVPDLITSLNFENSDNVTHLLVNTFTGSNGSDLDTDDDGELDAIPWSAILDGVAFVKEPNPENGPPATTEFEYASALGLPAIGTGGATSPRHLYRLPDRGPFQVGGFELGTNDTPGASNAPDGQDGLLGDMDWDEDVDFDDIGPFVLGLRQPVEYQIVYGVPPAVHGDIDRDTDHDFDDIPGFVALFVAGPVGAEPVAEPSTAMLLLLATAVAGACRPWRKRTFSVRRRRLRV